MVLNRPKWGRLQKNFTFNYRFKWAETSCSSAFAESLGSGGRLLQTLDAETENAWVL